MERIVYQKTLDVHKNGVQFTLQGFETADNLARRIEISLMASGDAIDFPLEKIMAVMYVNVPGTDGPSVIECEIKNSAVVYDVLPITVEGITEMQLKLIETGPEGATAVLAAPKFAVEVTKSNADEEGAVRTSTFTALEYALAKAKAVYDSRFLSMELSSDCMFRVKYADGTVFESDMLRELFHKGESILSQSYARGDTGVRKGEATDNSMYYSKVAKSASVDAEMSKESAQDILNEVRLHGVYTAFTVNLDTGEVEYISPKYSFKINTETGNMDADGQPFEFFDEIGELVNDWLIRRDVDVSTLLKISGEYSEDINNLYETTKIQGVNIKDLQDRVTPVKKGGTGFDNIDDFVSNNNICRVVVGSYVGTGKFGADNPNILTFSGKPCFLMLSGGSYSSFMVSRINNWYNPYHNLYMRNINFTWGDTFVSWYTSSGNDYQNISEQYNAEGTTYQYIAIICEPLEVER